MNTVLLAVLLGGVFGLFGAVCHEMNSRFNQRFADKSRKLQAVRDAHIEVHKADLNRFTAGESDPAARREFEQASEAVRRAEEVSKADRFPFRSKPVDPSGSD